MKAPAPVLLAATLLLLVRAGLAGHPDDAVARADADRAGGPVAFDFAHLAPDDVSMLLELRDARSIRVAFADLPIARAFHGGFGTGEVAAAWNRLARSAGLDDHELFDSWLGRRCALMLRRAETTTQWVVLTEVNRETAFTVLRTLRPKRLAPRHAVPLALIPEHELLIASDGNRFLIGPSTSPDLFNEVLARLARASPARDRGLIDHESMERSRSLGRGELAMFVRHERPLGGWSVLVGAVDEDRLHVRHAARFENPPFNRTVTELEWDMSALEAFDDRALVAVIEPTDIGGGPVEAFVQSRLGEPLISEEIRQNVADVRIVSVGEIEGRQQTDGVDMLLPAGAVAIRIKDRSGAEVSLDRHLIRITEAINDLGRGSYVIEIPSIGRFRAGQPRHIDLGPAMRHFGAGFPMLRFVTLDWRTVDGPHGSFHVIATHPEHLGETVDALKSPKNGETQLGRWTSCGLVNGRRVGVHLRSYSDQAQRLATEDPEAVAELQQTLRLLSQLAGGVDRLRWRLSRPSERDMRLEVEIELAPAESSGR